MLRRRALLWGLALLDLVVGRLPAPVAYGLAELGGRAWHRLATERRALVTENLRRVSAATGRPTQGAAFRRLVRDAFVEHARYYVELVRIRHYDPETIDDRLDVREWERWEPLVRTGVVIASLHIGNFEPYGIFIGHHRIAATAPVEEIDPPELFAWMHERRGAGHVNIIPLARARRPMIEALRRGEVVALIADRDLAGDGIEVSLFGHPTTLPSGPASLALLTKRPLMVASCLRAGHDRFRARGWAIELELSGDRRTDLEALTRAVAARFEEAIAEAPAQWWGAFQPIWSDQRPTPAAAAPVAGSEA